MTTHNLRDEWKILTLLRKAILPRWPRQSLGSFWSPRTAPKEASTIYSETFKGWLVSNKYTKSPFPKPSLYHHVTFLEYIIGTLVIHLYSLMMSKRNLWINPNSCFSDFDSSNVCIARYLAYLPVIMWWPLRGDVTLIRCEPPEPGDHVTSVPGPWHSTAQSRHRALPLTARYRPGTGLTAWSPPGRGPDPFLGNARP